MRRVIALLPFVLVVAAGCGGGDSTETVTVGSTGTAPPLSKAEYIEQADAICAGFRPKAEALTDEANKLADQGDSAGAADKLGEAIDVSRAGVEELQSLPKPQGDEAVLNQLDDLRQQALALLERVEDAIRADDISRLDALTSEATSVDDRGDGIATGYGFKTCGQN